VYPKEAPPISQAAPPPNLGESHVAPSVVMGSSR